MITIFINHSLFIIIYFNLITLYLILVFICDFKLDNINLEDFKESMQIKLLKRLFIQNLEIIINNNYNYANQNRQIFAFQLIIFNYSYSIMDFYKV